MTLMLIILLLLQIPKVQNTIGHFVFDTINRSSISKLSFDSVSINWFDDVRISGFRIDDYSGNTLFKADGLLFDYDLNQVLRKTSLTFDKVEVVSGQLALVKYRDSLDINLVVFLEEIRSLLNSGKAKTKDPRSIQFDNINLINCRFSYDNRTKDSLDHSKLDYSHLTWNLNQAKIKNFVAMADSLTMEIYGFEGIDSISGFEVKALNSRLTVFKKGMYFDELTLVTEKSEIKNQIHLNYEKISDINDFIKSVDLDAVLKNSKIGLSDIKYFANVSVPDLEILVDSRFIGKISDLEFNDLKINLGRSNVKGDLSLTGLPIFKETFVVLKIVQSDIYLEDVMRIQNNLPDQLTKFKRLGLKADLVGFLNDFVSKATVDTEYGRLIADLNLKFPNDIKKASYSGNLGALGFSLGEYLNLKEYFGEISFNGYVKGKGVTLNNGEFSLDANFQNFDIKDYRYKSLFISGIFKKKYFNGVVNMSDKQAKIDGDIFIDLNQTPELIQFNLHMDTVNLDKINLVNQPLALKGDVVAKLKGTSLDSLIGDLKAYEVDLKSNDRTLRLDSIIIQSEKDGNFKNISLTAPDFEANIIGDIAYSQVIKDLQNFNHSILSRLTNDSTSNGYELSEDPYYDLDIDISYQDLNYYFDFFNIPLFLSENGNVAAHFDRRSGLNFNLFTSLDSLVYDKWNFRDVDVELDISASIIEKDILGHLLISSDKQRIYNFAETENLAIEVTWLNDEIFTRSKINQKASSSRIAINTKIQIDTTSIFLKVLPSTLELDTYQWTFNPFNNLRIYGDSLVMDRMEVYNGMQSIVTTGNYDFSGAKNLGINIKWLDLSIFNIFSKHNFEGILNNSITFISDANDSSYLLSSTDLKSFFIDEIDVGTVKGESKLVRDSAKLDVQYDIIRDDGSEITLSGDYHLDSLDSPLNLLLSFNNADLELVTPFLKNLFSRISGEANGSLNITGHLSEPKIEGKTQISNGHLLVNYLNTEYDLNGAVVFTNDKIQFRQLNFFDREENRSVLSGFILHDGFKDMEVNLSIAANNMLFLNTSSANNDVYYGTAYGTGDLTITGPFDDILIKASATTEKGTKLYLPLSSTSDVSTKEYISFIDITKTNNELERIQKIVNTNLAGVSFELDVTITEDAYVELIFDIKTGDIIRGRGRGNLNMKLNTNGEFDLFGGVNITEGAYNFTIPNLINKEFSIVPGSTITWYGDPYAGILNLAATYRQMASLGDFLVAGATDVNNRIPFLVKLQLDGEMLAPNILFSIDFDENLSNISIRDEEVLSTLNEDEQELKRQVFSLLILKKLSPQNTFAVGGEAFGSSVSEFLSNQFSYFLSQVDENLEFDFDLGSLDQNALENVQLRLSYTFLDGRLKVTGGAQTDVTENSNQFLGDWSVRYSLTEDGQLRVRAFSQNEQVIDEWQRETGLSLQLVKSFDDLKDLVNKSKEKKVLTQQKLPKQ